MSRTCWLFPLLACTRALPGQDLPRLQARADSLAREWRRANAVADAIDSLERTRAPSGRDTIRVGALTIVTSPSPLPLRDAAVRAWPVIDSLYGDEARQLAKRPYLIAAVDPDTTVEPPPTHRGMAIPWDQDVAYLTQLLLSNVPVAPADTALQSWLGGPLQPLVEGDLERPGVYVELVTTPSQASRRCLIGDIGGCRNALDLAEDGDPLQRWYPSAPERRSVVLKSNAYFNRGPQLTMLQACANGSDSACTQLLRSVPPGALPRPLTYHARATLINVALQLGGRGPSPGPATVNRNRPRYACAPRRSRTSGGPPTWCCGWRGIDGNSSRSSHGGARAISRGRH